MQEILNSIWYEKYRPKTLGEIALPENVRSKIKEYIDNKNIPHLLFSGVWGIGKTTLAKIICNEVSGKEDYIYINASEVGIEEIRTDVNDFIKVKSFNGNVKIVLLDEIDGLGGSTSTAAQDALRGTIEENSQHTRFIATCNNLNKVTKGLQSRFEPFDVTPSLVDYFKRVIYILKQENIVLTDKLVEEIKTMCKTYYPDMRTVLNELHKLCNKNVLTITSTGNAIDLCSDILNLIKNKQSDHEIRKLLIEGKRKFNGNYNVFYKTLFETIYNSGLDDEKLRGSLIIAGEFLYKNSTIIDPEINAFCCLLSIKNLINS